MAKYPGKKPGWGRDQGSVPGHPIKHPQMIALGQAHTPYDSRGFHADKGSNTKPESYHRAKSNRFRHEQEAVGVNGARGAHNPLPSHYHRNSGTESDGHQVMKRGGSVYRSHRGMKD